MGASKLGGPAGHARGFLSHTRCHVFTDPSSFFNAVQSLPCQATFDSSISLGPQLFSQLFACQATTFPFTVATSPFSNLFGVPGSGATGPLDRAVAGPSLVLTFNNGPTAVAGLFWLVDNTPTLAGGSLQVDLSDGTSTIATVQPLGNPYVFLGFVGSTPLTSLSLTAAPGENPVVDGVLIGTQAPAPEPTSQMLMGAGIAAFAAAYALRRRTMITPPFRR